MSYIRMGAAPPLVGSSLWWQQKAAATRAAGRGAARDWRKPPKRDPRDWRKTPSTPRPHGAPRPHGRGVATGVRGLERGGRGDTRSDSGIRRGGRELVLTPPLTAPPVTTVTLEPVMTPTGPVVGAKPVVPPDTGGPSGGGGGGGPWSPPPQPGMPPEAPPMDLEPGERGPSPEAPATGPFGIPKWAWIAGAAAAGYWFFIRKKKVQP